jgi:hypothetical protein
MIDCGLCSVHRPLFKIPFETRSASLCPHDREFTSRKALKFKLLAKGEPSKITARGLFKRIVSWMYKVGSRIGAVYNGSG